MPNEIANAALTENDLPDPKADWSIISRFALSFNGYEYWGAFDKCGEVAKSSVKAYTETKALPDSLAELRTCLFFEQRRWRHYGETPDDRAMSYIHALVEGIRGKVRTKE